MKRSAIIVLFPLFIIGLLAYTSFAQRNQEKIYVGEEACRECHHLSGERDQFNPWRMSQHSKGYASLAMPEAMEIARLSGVAVDPFESPICLGCHVTASDVEEWERDETFHIQDGVQCEFCHGPGSEYMDAETMMNPDATKQAGLRYPEEEDCLVCHKEKGSHVAVLDVQKFVYEEALKKIAHPGKGGPLTPTESQSAELVPGPKFVGALACGECHGETTPGHQYSKWRTSAHAQAYAVLGTAKAREIAISEGVSGNPQKSAACLSCHTTGAEKDAGHFTPQFDQSQGVQCESCHGAGSEYMLEATMIDPVAAAEAGLQDVSQETCTGCHTPGIHGHEFDFESMWKEIDHTKWEDYSYSDIEYKTPFNIAITDDGKRLFTACEESNSMIVLNARSGKILEEVEVNAQPHFVFISDDGSRAYVANRGSDNVSIIDTKSYKVLGEIVVGDEPHEITSDATGNFLYVANAGSYDISIIDVRQNEEIKRLAASRGTWGVARNSDGSKVYVTNNLPRFVDFRETSKSELTVIDTKTNTIDYRHTLDHANLLQGVAVSPGDEFVMTTLIRTKNLVPMTRTMQGWIITNGISIIWPDGQIDQVLLDEPDNFFADPTDVVFSNDGKYAFVTGGGVREVAVVDIARLTDLLKAASTEDRKERFPDHLGLSSEYVVKRIPVGRSPRGMVVSPDNKFLYVADGLDDAISVIDIQRLEKVNTLDLGGPEEITEARYGNRIFHSADATWGRQFSCHSCHPDGGIDGITYDIEPDGLGLNPVDNRSLRGVNDTAPFKWTGKNPTLKRQCGPRLAAFFTRINPFTPEEAAALDRYIVTIPNPPNRYRDIGEDLTPAQRRGKRLFERDFDKAGNPIPEIKQCNYCHRPPYYTDRNAHDVGTKSWLDTHGTFDTPHLTNIYASPPYLHDGRAESLEEIWTVYNPNDTHGLTNDMTKDELNDLIEFLKTL